MSINLKCDLSLFLEYCQSYKRRPEYVKTISADGRHVGGLVQLNKQIYIVETALILVYEAQAPFKRQSDIKMKELVYPFGVAACDRNKCIYVSDKASECVWRVSEKYEVKQLIAGLRGTGKLSVMSNGDLIVLEGGQLNIYKPNGNKLKNIPLPQELAEPEHAIESTRGTFFISQGITAGIHRICEISCDTGTILQSYGDRKGNAKGQLDFPAYIALDPEGRLFVCDYGNSRILLLDGNLKLQRVLLSNADDGIPSSMNMFYAKESGNLLLGAVSIVNGGVRIHHIRKV